MGFGGQKVKKQLVATLVKIKFHKGQIEIRYLFLQYFGSILFFLLLFLNIKEKFQTFIQSMQVVHVKVYVLSAFIQIALSHLLTTKRICSEKGSQWFLSRILSY